MGDLPHYFDIILFAMIAAFLVLRLRSVLGRRTGNERRRDSYLRDTAAADKVVPIGQRPAPPPPPITMPPPRPADTVSGGLAQITAVDRGFTAADFLTGVRGAFEMIVAGFAAGDKAKLRALLADEVFNPFSAAIDERVAAGETLETRIVALKDIDITAAGLSGRTARITAKLVSDQIYVLHAHDGSVVDGDPQHPIEKTDFWTFERDTASADPNWLLAATSSG